MLTLSQSIDTPPAANDSSIWEYMLVLTYFGIPYIPALIQSADDYSTEWAE